MRNFVRHWDRAALLHQQAGHCDLHDQTLLVTEGDQAMKIVCFHVQFLQQLVLHVGGIVTVHSTRQTNAIITADIANRQLPNSICGELPLDPTVT